MDKVQQHIFCIVDDDDIYRKSLVRLLKSAGYSVQSFPSAQSFIDSVHVAYEVGVLILDLRMPNMDGFDLQQRLNELKSKFQIIFITADARPGDREHALQSGAMAFLQKPFQEQILFETIDLALSRFTDEDMNRDCNENEKEQ